MSIIEWYSTSVLLIVLSSPFVLGLQNLTFYGKYVVFKPETSFIKFDLWNQVDVVLLEHRVKDVNSNPLYRVHLVRSDIVETQENATNIGVSCTIYKNGESKLHGRYQYWDDLESSNMAIRWNNEKINLIEILTSKDGNYSSIFSWRDKPTNNTVLPKVKYIGLAVIESDQNLSHHGHLTWKIREEDDVETSLRHSLKIVHVRLFSGATNSTPIYEIFVEREKDTGYWLLVRKGSERVTKTKIYQINGMKDLSLSWDNDRRVLAVGRKTSQLPAVLWQDPSEENDFLKIQNVTLWTRDTNKEWLFQVKNENFLKISDLFPFFRCNFGTRTLETVTPTSVLWSLMNHRTTKDDWVEPSDDDQ